MPRLLLVIAIAMAGSLTAADFNGRWAGIATNAGTAVPIHLTLRQQGELVSGSIVQGEGKDVPIGEAVVHATGLRFNVSASAGRPAKFALTFMVNGHPLGDRQIMLEGTAIAADGESTVTLYPVTDNADNAGVALVPLLLHKVEPRYTRQAREANIQGTVVLQVEIEQTGTVSKQPIRVIRSLGYGLDEAAVECARQWHFKPGFKNGYAVRMAALIEVNFRF